MGKALLLLIAGVLFYFIFIHQDATPALADEWAILYVDNNGMSHRSGSFNNKEDCQNQMYQLNANQIECGSNCVIQDGGFYRCKEVVSK